MAALALGNIKKPKKHEKLSYLDENIHSMQDQIKQLQSDLKKKSDGSTSGTASGPEMVKKRSFDQLVKEVDQCFAELGRQVQREAKHRQTMEQAIHQLELNIPELGGSRQGGFDPEIDKRLSKCENLASELKKDLKKEKKRVEKLQVQSDSQSKNQINQKMIEETIQTIMIDVVDELTENEARQFEIFNRRINETDEILENTRQQRNIQDKKINSELRRLGAIIDSQKLLKNQV